MFPVQHIEDVAGAEACGALKNVVALGAEFSDSTGLSSNTKAAFMLFCGTSVCDYTFFESFRMVDLITTCFGDRNRKCAEEFSNIVLAEDHTGSSEN
eukprot:CAMPEP_0171310782 /NCGR_PEP_ID=MMETSP0816-20121228/20983_1 /TAXON_ID=420281 /ORGANISM="Proboscia inermis, Strain CCAP1064/1" /LENGTH=96 /DNA_ID=CAMNT_0011795119 /DNA_START=49 /DNA_END=336 /DNA_ORIENTATION=+